VSRLEPVGSKIFRSGPDLLSIFGPGPGLGPGPGPGPGPGLGPGPGPGSDRVRVYPTGSNPDGAGTKIFFSLGSGPKTTGPARVYLRVIVNTALYGST
jgi:hypothetical protein